MKRILAAALLFLPIVSGSLTLSQLSRSEGRQTLESLERLLQVPANNYRRNWVSLGTYSVRSDEPEKGAKELHVVYAPPSAVRSFQRDGSFPDGTVLVKDVFEAKTEALTTGTASYAGNLKGRFVMVRDAQNRHAETSPLWGDGWGWSFYEGEERRKTVTTDYRQDCLGCHEPARAQGLVYLQGYPVLRRN